MAGELRSSQNSFSNIFFLRRSMARLCPLLAFCRRGVDRSFCRCPWPHHVPSLTPEEHTHPSSRSHAIPGHPHPPLTSFCTSLLMAEIFIFMSSSSWSGMTWT